MMSSVFVAVFVIVVSFFFSLTSHIVLFLFIYFFVHEPGYPQYDFDKFMFGASK